jgi:DeoR family suf operon transcriptional repressor
MVSPDFASPRAPVSGEPRSPSDLRTDVLLCIKQRGSATAAEIAAALRRSLNAVRHHLKRLEHQGVVEHQRARHGVGAPAHRYGLTSQGQALFPDHYADTLAHLLDHLSHAQGRDASLAVLEAHYGELGVRLCAETADLPPRERGEHIARVLADAGFLATWTPTDTGGELTARHCPHLLVAERFPELCRAEEAYLARAFDAPVERQSRIAGGCGCCTYRITLEPDAPKETR